MWHCWVCVHILIDGDRIINISAINDNSVISVMTKKRGVGVGPTQLLDVITIYSNNIVFSAFITSTSYSI
jgi:hypothetical protein